MFRAISFLELPAVPSIRLSRAMDFGGSRESVASVETRILMPGAAGSTEDLTKQRDDDKVELADPVSNGVLEDRQTKVLAVPQATRYEEEKSESERSFAKLSCTQVDEPQEADEELDRLGPLVFGKEDQHLLQWTDRRPRRQYSIGREMVRQTSYANLGELYQRDG